MCRTAPCRDTSPFLACAAAEALNKHMNWLTGPGIDLGKRNAPVDLSMRHLRATLALAEVDGTRDPQE